MKKKKGRQRQWQTQIQKFSAAADGKAGADESNSGNPNTPHKCKNGISITWNCANEVLGNFAYKNMWYKQICIPRVQMWANMQMRKCEMCIYANEKMSVVQVCKCGYMQICKWENEQMQETASTWSPECGKSSTWELAPESDSTLGNIKSPRIHTNIGTK